MLATSQMTSRSPTRKIPYTSGNHLFISFLKKNPLIFSVAVVILAINSVLGLLPAVIIGRSLDILLDIGFGTDFVLSALLIVAVALLNFAFTFISSYVFVITAFRFERDLRQEFFDIIQSHSLRFHDENNSSKLLSLAMNEMQLIRTGIMPSLRMLIQAVVSVFLILAFFYQTLPEPLLPAIVLLGFLVYFYFAYRYARSITPIRIQLSEELGNLTEQSQEIFKGVEVVRSLSASDREVDKFKTVSSDYAKVSRNEGRLSAFYIPGLILLVLTAIVFSLLIFDVVDGVITIGEMVSLLGLLISMQFINFTMPIALLHLRAALVNSQRVFEKMSWEDEGYFKDVNGKDKINWEGNLQFDNVTFSYGENYGNSLRSVSFVIPGKSKVALIGGPGSGKTTMLKLLLDLYQPQDGTISIDGVDYRNISERKVRSHVTMVEQDVFLFSGTIRENVAFTKPDASEEDLMKAIKAAQALEFIEKLPDGIDTIIGERGVTLSGGQRQRIAIARAILAGPEILLLDDSSSALDSKTEQLIRKALDNLNENRLTITVTQRLNTLVRADLIILMDRGDIVALGNHARLYQESEKYRTIFELLPESERISIDDLEGGRY